MSALLTLQNVEAGIGADYRISVPSAHFERGKLHLLVGGNGVGKSSLLRLMLGFIPASRGEIIWDLHERRVNFKGDARSARRAIFQYLGYVQQGESSLWPQYTAKDHVRHALLNRPIKFGDMSQNEITEKVIKSLDRARIPRENWDKRPTRRSVDGAATSLSGGERQRISYARAIVCDPEVLVFDELEASLDEETRRQFVDSVLRDYLAEDHHTAFVVTHDPASWLQGEWNQGDRQVWRVKKVVSSISLEREEQSERSHKSAPQETMSRLAILMKQAADLESELAQATNATPPAKGRMAGFKLAHMLYGFVRRSDDMPAPIVTVVGKEGATALSTGAVLLGVASRPGTAPNGNDRQRIAAFLDKGQFAGRHHAPPDQPPPLDKGLMVDLLKLSPREEAYKGNRLDLTVFDTGIMGETFLFSQSAAGDLDRSRNRYLELSKDTRMVYLFRAIRPEIDGKRLVVSIDVLDDATLDSYQCYFVMQAMERVLASLE